MMSHTPIPWHYTKFDDGDNAILDSEGDTRICEMVTNEPDDVRDCNAEFITKAVNHHDELVLAVIALRALLAHHRALLFSTTLMSADDQRRIFDNAGELLSRIDS